VAAGDACIDRSDLAVRHQLGLFDRVLDGVHRGVDVHHDPLAQPARGMGPDADDVDTVLRSLRDDGTDLGRADVESYDYLVVACH